MLATVIILIIAICLVATVIWAFQTYVTIPGPFAWLKGIIIFIMILLACYFIWDQVIAGHLVTRSLR